MGREFPYTPQGMAEAEQYRQAVGMRGGGMMGFRPVGYADAGVVSLAQNDFKAFLNPPDDRPPPNELEVNNYIYQNMGDLQTAAQEDRNFGAYLDQIKARTGFETFFENVIAVNEQLGGTIPGTGGAVNEQLEAPPAARTETLEDIQAMQRLGQEFDFAEPAPFQKLYDYETQLLRERSAPYMMAEDERAAGTNAQQVQQMREIRKLMEQMDNQRAFEEAAQYAPMQGMTEDMPVGMKRGGIMSLRGY